MKKTFENPEMNLYVFKVQDVITASPASGTGGNDNQLPDDEFG